VQHHCHHCCRGEGPPKKRAPPPDERSIVKGQTMLDHALSALHVGFSFERGINSIYYHDVTSSSAKSTPPTGARKAAATPAAAPQVMRSLRSRSFLKYLIQFQVRPYFRDPPCPSKEATQAPVCTIGPSLPSTNPADTPNIEPKICILQ